MPRSFAATADLGEDDVFAAPAVEHDPPGLPWLAERRQSVKERVVTVLRAPTARRRSVAKLRVTFFAVAHGTLFATMIQA